MRISPRVISRDNILGGSRLENGTTPKTQILDHLPGFETTFFFDFQKILFSLHPMTQSIDQVIPAYKKRTCRGCMICKNAFNHL